MIATTTISASAEAVFDVLADPNTHAAIDGTGWVRNSLDGRHLTKPGQIFRMAMYHDNHPDKHYDIANRVVVCDPPEAIAWEPGQDVSGRGVLMDAPAEGDITFGGWIWRYDLEQVGPWQTEVRLTYDWSAVPPPVRAEIGFPPFPREHLDNSLTSLAGLVGRAASG